MRNRLAGAETIAQRVAVPVNPELFLEAVQAFQEAAERPLPTPTRRVAGYYLTDIPLNRGMLGAMAALRAKGAGDVAEPVLFRLMNLGQIFEARDIFGRFMKLGAEETAVSDSLLMAAAVAGISAADGPAFDLDDVLKHACRFDEEAATKEEAN